MGPTSSSSLSPRIEQRCRLYSACAFLDSSAATASLCAQQNVARSSLTRTICKSTADVCETYMKTGYATVDTDARHDLQDAAHRPVGLSLILSCGEYCSSLGMTCIAQFDDDSNGCDTNPQPGSCDSREHIADFVCRCGPAGGFVLRPRGTARGCNNTNHYFLGHRPTTDDCAGACRIRAGCTRFVHSAWIRGGACWEETARGGQPAEGGASGAPSPAPREEHCGDAADMNIYDLNPHGFFTLVGNGYCADGAGATPASFFRPADVAITGHAAGKVTPSSCTASSEHDAHKRDPYNCSKVFDGNMGSSWLTAWGAGVGTWIKLQFSRAHTLTVVHYANANIASIKEIRLEFSDGGTQQVTLGNDVISARRLAPVTTTFVKIVVASMDTYHNGRHIGAREISFETGSSADFQLVNTGTSCADWDTVSPKMRMQGKNYSAGSCAVECSRQVWCTHFYLRNDEGVEGQCSLVPDGCTEAASKNDRSEYYAMDLVRGLSDLWCARGCQSLSTCTAYHYVVGGKYAGGCRLYGNKLDSKALRIAALDLTSDAYGRSWVDDGSGTGGIDVITTTRPNGNVRCYAKSSAGTNAGERGEPGKKVDQAVGGADAQRQIWRKAPTQNGLYILQLRHGGASRSCPVGTDVPKERCFAAALAAGAQVGRSGKLPGLYEGTWGHTPRGCFIHSNYVHGIEPHFSSGNGRNNGDWEPVCEETASTGT